MEIINKKIEELKEYKNNPRNNKEAIKYVANSIKEFGFKVPIILDKNNEIICGHTRYNAAKKLKLKEVPCIIADDLSDEQIKAFRLADNKVSEIATWDLELLDLELKEIDDLFNMNDFGFDFNLDLEEKEETKEITEEKKEDIEVNLGDILEIGERKIFYGNIDVVNEFKEDIENYKVDIIITNETYLNEFLKECKKKKDIIKILNKKVLI